MLFQKAYSQMQQEIATTEDTILDLQRQLESLQKHLQALGSVEQASVSALEQVKTAVSMINAVAPKEMETFRQALLGELNSDTELFPEVIDNESETTIYKGNSYDDAEEDIPTVSVEVFTEDETVDVKSNGHKPVEVEPEPDLSDITTGYIRALVREKGLDAVGDRNTLIGRLEANGMSKWDIAGVPTTNNSALATRDLKSRLAELNKDTLNNIYEAVGLGKPGTRTRARKITMILEQPQSKIEAALENTVL